MTQLSVATEQIEGVRCAVWARDVGLEPVGTAPAPTGWILVDWPLPWPRDAADVEAMAPLHAAATTAGYRVQLVVPRPDCTGARVVVHHRAIDDDGWFAGMRRAAADASPEDVVDVACSLIGSGAVGGDETPPADVLVCGHGARDRCCGSLGTALAVEGTALGLGVMRTSHLGGHRFAATAVVLPAGTAWAFLGPPMLAAVARAEGPLDEALAHYRGSVGFAPGAAQAAEREAFREVGWAWLGWQRRALDLGDGVVRVEAVDAAGGEHAWEVRTEPGRTLPVPECGAPLDAAKKSETEVLVTAVERLG
jgi:hypothetical protein